MSLPLTHSPADVLAQLLVDKGVASGPGGSGTWPVYVGGEPSSPDEVLTLYDTTNQGDGRAMADGESFTHYGFQVKIRANDAKSGRTKADVIRVTLDEIIYADTVIVETVQYKVHCIAKTNLLTLGKDRPNSERSAFTINGLVTLKRLA